jgi:MFS transporter, ACS family, hexuronate transporter
MADQNSIVETESGRPEDASASSPTESRTASVLKGRFRWTICGLLFLGVTENYMDRQLLGVLKGPLQQEFGWNDIDYGNLVFSFQASSGVCAGNDFCRPPD